MYSKYSKSDSVFVNRNIRAGYTHNWIVDGLPASMILYDATTSTNFMDLGSVLVKLIMKIKLNFTIILKLLLNIIKEKRMNIELLVTVSPASLIDQN